MSSQHDIAQAISTPPSSQPQSPNQLTKSSAQESPRSESGPIHRPSSLQSSPNIQHAHRASGKSSTPNTPTKASPVAIQSSFPMHTSSSQPDVGQHSQPHSSSNVTTPRRNNHKNLADNGGSSSQLLTPPHTSGPSAPNPNYTSTPATASHTLHHTSSDPHRPGARRVHSTARPTSASNSTVSSSIASIPSSPTTQTNDPNKSDASTNPDSPEPSAISAAQLVLIQQAYAAQQQTQTQQEELRAKLSATRRTPQQTPSNNPPSHTRTHSSTSAGGFGSGGRGGSRGGKARSPAVAIFNGVKVGGGVDGYGGPRDETSLVRRYTAQSQAQIQVQLEMLMQQAEELRERQLRRGATLRDHQRRPSGSIGTDAGAGADPAFKQNLSDVELAQQLSMLGMLNELKKSEASNAAPGRSGQGTAGYGGQQQQQQTIPPGNGLNMGVGLGLGLENYPAPTGRGGGSDNPINGSSPYTSSPRTDPLYNPNRTSNVYINNLPTTFTEKQLLQLCAAFGSILSVRMMVRESGTCYGFVLFETIEAAESCILWLRQFSDVHPSFARTPKIGQRTPATTQIPALPNTLASPIQIQGPEGPRQSLSERQEHFANSPYHHQQQGHQISVSPPPPVASNRTLLPTLRQHHPSELVITTPNNRIQSSPLSHRIVPGGSTIARTPGGGSNSGNGNSAGDVRAPYGRISTLPPLSSVIQQQQQQHQQHPHESASNTNLPFTPPRSGFLQQQQAGASIASSTALPSQELEITAGPNLFIDGLPNSIDLPTLEALFSPHRVLSARFFRPSYSNGTASSTSAGVVAFARLSSFEAADEAIDRLNGHSPGWEESGGGKMTVRYADPDSQSNLTLSEKRLQTLIARHAGPPPSPLIQKTNTLSHIGSMSHSLPPQATAPNLPNIYGQQRQAEAENGATFNAVKAAQPASAQQFQPRPLNLNYTVNLPTDGRASFTEYREPPPLHGIVSSSEEDAYSDSIVDGDVTMRTATPVESLPPVDLAYRVPNNTPARPLEQAPSQVSTHPRLPPGPRYVVQLPSTMLRQRPDLSLAADAASSNPVHSTAERNAHVPPFRVPPPSLFKAAPRSGPLSIRPPPPTTNLVNSTTADTSPNIVEFKEIHPSHAGVQQDQGDHDRDVQRSPASSISSGGTGTPATTGGPFTPYVGSFSPPVHRTFGDDTVAKKNLQEGEYHPRADITVRFADETRHIA